MLSVGSMVRVSPATAATPLKVRRGRSWPVSAVCVLLAMLVTVSLQSEVQWGTEYPLVPWEDMWQEMEMMSVGMNCVPEDSTCRHVTNTNTSQKLVPQWCR